MQVLRHQILDLINVVYCETNIDSSDACAIANEVNELVKVFGIREGKKLWFVLRRNQDCAAIEAILFPIDPPASKKGSLYTIRERIHIESAVKIRHEGDWDLLEETVAYLDRYIEEHNLTMITTYYCSVLAGLEHDGLRDVIVDIYVGVSRNIV